MNVPGCCLHIGKSFDTASQDGFSLRNVRRDNGSLRQQFFHQDYFSFRLQ